MLLENPINRLEPYNYLKVDKRLYHEVDYRTNPKSTYNFLYIGSDEAVINSLYTSFENGSVVESLAEAINMLFDSTKRITTDVIILDSTSKSTKSSLNQFTLGVQSGLISQIPVIYNESETTSSISLEYIDIIDDVIDLENFHYDISSKIHFLNKAKVYKSIQANPLVLTHYLNYGNIIIKRAFDIVMSFCLLVFLLPVFILIALFIKLESRGPIFYNSKRAGKGFRVFKFYKFRTMELNADKKVESLAHLNQYGSANGAKFFKITNDPRITKVGKFLRNTSLDELPQLFNVFKGDMSLVGNRPLPLYEAATLTTNESVERFMAPAGITGLWQIKKRGKADMSSEERIGLDISYARKSNLIFDFWILAKTPGALFQKTNV